MQIHLPVVYVYHPIINAQAPYYVDGIAIFGENTGDTMRTVLDASDLYQIFTYWSAVCLSE